VDGEWRYRDRSVRRGHTYVYWVRGRLQNGRGFASGRLAVHVPAAQTLLDASVQPFPARGSVTIRFSLPEAESVTVNVFDVRGQRVRALDRRARAPGEHRIDWDGRNDRGHPVGAGLYFVRVSAKHNVSVARAVIVR